MVLQRFMRVRRGLALALTLALVGSLLAGASVALAAKPGTAYAYLTSVELGGCNRLEYGVVRSDGRLHRLGSNRGGECGEDPVSLRDKRVTYVVEDGLILYLRDVTCDKIYRSDGSGDADHALVSEALGADKLDITDAGGGCEDANSERIPSADEGNLQLFVNPAGALVVTG